MCGLFGYIGSRPFVAEKLEAIARGAASRGPHGFGLWWSTERRGVGDAYRARGPLEDDLGSLARIDARSVAVLGHARLVTTGTDLDDIASYQPLLVDTIAGRAERGQITIAHNGTVPDPPFYEKMYDLTRKTDNDSEIIAAFAADTHGDFFDRMALALAATQGDRRPYAILAHLNGKLFVARRRHPLYWRSYEGGIYVCSRRFSGAEEIPESVGAMFDPSVSTNVPVREREVA